MTHGLLLPRTSQNRASKNSLDFQNPTVGLVSLPFVLRTAIQLPHGGQPKFPFPKHHKPSPPYERHCTFTLSLFPLMNPAEAMELSRGSEGSGLGHRDHVLLSFLTLTTFIFVPSYPNTPQPIHPVPHNQARWCSSGAGR